jgi:hypothetical protein
MRTRKVPTLAFPFGSCGLPGFLFRCFKVSELLYDCCSSDKLLGGSGEDQGQEQQIAADDNTEKPRKHRTIGQKWRAVSINNKLIVTFAGITTVATLLYSVFAGWQLYEIHSGAKDTHDLAIHAKEQANKMKDMSDAADKIRQASEGMVKQEQRIADNAKSALDASNRQAKTALDASIAASHSDQRAYVTLGRQDGTVAEVIMPKTEAAKAALIVYFQNTGHLPARFNFGPDNTIIGVISPSTLVETDHRFEPMWRGRNKNGHNFGWSGTITIAGHSSYSGVLFELPQEQLRQLLDKPIASFFSTYGKYEYCDGFGKRVCHRFGIRYASEPYNRFFLGMDDECMVSDLQVEMSGIMKRNPTWEYLNPCAVERKELNTPFKQLPQLPK